MLRAFAHKARVEPDVELHLMGATRRVRLLGQAWVAFGQERQQDLYAGEEAAAGGVEAQLPGEAAADAIVAVPIGNLEALLHAINQRTGHRDELEAKKRRRGE
jgi:hypothetical protein